MVRNNNRNTTTTSVMSFWRLAVNFEHISRIFLVLLCFILLTLDKEMVAALVVNTS